MNKPTIAELKEKLRLVNEEIVEVKAEIKAEAKKKAKTPTTIPLSPELGSLLGMTSVPNWPFPKYNSSEDSPVVPDVNETTATPQVISCITIS